MYAYETLFHIIRCITEFIIFLQLTGTPLQGGKRVQFNMFLKPINQITLTENLTTSLVPTIWVEEVTVPRLQCKSGTKPFIFYRASLSTRKWSTS